MTSTRETETAWAAGLFDGEGWAGVQTGRTTPKLKIDMTDLDLLRRFRAAVGDVGVLVDEPLKRNVPEHYLPMYSWRTSGPDSITVIEALLPYVGPRNVGRFTKMRDDYLARCNRTCEQCGKRFRPTTRPDARFCTKACADQKRRPHASYTVACGGCGETFTASTSRAKTCSKRCWRTARRAAGLPAS